MLSVCIGDSLTSSGFCSSCSSIPLPVPFLKFEPKFEHFVEEGFVPICNAGAASAAGAEASATKPI